MKRESKTLIRLSCLVLATVMTMAALTGCGSKEPAETTVPTTIPETEPTVVTEPPETTYTSDLPLNTEAVADLISIEPMFRLGETADADSETEYSDYVCKAATTDGRSIWLLVPIDTYDSCFASALSYGTEEAYGIIDLSFSTITFAQPLHVTGIVQDSEEACPGLTALLNPDPNADETAPVAGINVLQVSNFDRTALSAALGLNQTASEETFSAASGILEQSYTDLVAITPACIIDSADLSKKEVVCVASDLVGNHVWLYMTAEAYIQNFDANGQSLKNMNQVVLPENLHVEGIVRFSEDLNPGLQTFSGAEKMLLLTSCTPSAYAEETEATLPADPAADGSVAAE